MPKTGKPKPRGAAGAARLRATIGKLSKAPKDVAAAPQAPDAARPLSPREFIHKRMAELDRKKKG